MMTKQPAAVIDVGTNSTLLLIGEPDSSGRINSLHQEFKVTRLGEGVHDDGMLKEPAIERTVQTLEHYRATIASFNAHPVHIVGTQALRLAKNSDRFRQIVTERLGWDVRILTGEEEAGCSFAGALDAVSLNPGEKVVVMDVGGGSSEVVLGDNSGTADFTSLPFGVVKIGEQYGMPGQLSPAQRTEIISDMAARFAALDFIDDITPDVKFIGVGGTVTTLAAIREKMMVYNPEQINGYAMTDMQIARLFDELNSVSLEQRRGIPGLVAGREDVILFGTLIFIAFMQQTRHEIVYASDRGLRFGYLKRLFAGQVE
jgi:exopolyphosphatase/guanosine-5'-triphosphate,3'-diphosphate pyrophosphatase